MIALLFAPVFCQFRLLVIAKINASKNDRFTSSSTMTDTLNVWFTF
jgi:hypothetical protein